MSTGLIILIVVVVLILLALLFVLPRMRRNRELKARQRELEQRRERAAGEHRAEAEERRGQAEMAEQKAQVAAAEAQRERAEAEIREQRAKMHERGMADDELVDESERERFAGTSAVRDERTGDESGTVRDEAAATRSDEPGTARGTETGAVSESDRPMHEPSEYDQGRIDEREGRPDRDAERTDDPSRPRPS